MQWTVGQVRITRIVELETVGGTRFILPQVGPDDVKALPWLIPQFANDEGRMKLTVQSLVLETPSQRIVVDTCLGNDKQGRKTPVWNGLHTPFIADMTVAGYPPETIDMVVCTHLHVDHVGWNTRLVDGNWVPTFPKARYVFGRREYEHWHLHRDTPGYAAVFDDSITPIIDADRADLVACDQQLSDEITLVPTPGHSPGHMSILIRSDGEQGLLAGDVAHHPVQMAHPGWSSSADSDPLQSATTRRELFGRFADTPTLVIGGHFEAGHIKRDGDTFRFDALAHAAG
jgi:glyoxylase-like metal-dependent hydrolase (beta-lactamase superfamily II)